jgi:hypothetical protein
MGILLKFLKQKSMFKTTAEIGRYRDNVDTVHS